jgi:hypothetical protein
VRCRSSDGQWQVDVIHLELTPNHHNGTWLRVSRWSYHVADVRTTEELAEYVDLADLEEALVPCLRRAENSHRHGQSTEIMRRADKRRACVLGTGTRDSA